MVGPTMARRSRTRRRKPPKPQRREFEDRKLGSGQRRSFFHAFFTGTGFRAVRACGRGAAHNEALVAGLVGGVEGGVGKRGVWDDEA